MHEKIQSYLEHIYLPFEKQIKQTLFFYGNEQYGELYYYSAVKLLTYLNLKNTDHFLDIGSGLGRIIFQVFFTTNAASITGIEINHQRYALSEEIKVSMQRLTPERFTGATALNIMEGDFLKHNFDDISIIYVCSTVFSFELLAAMGSKINAMNSVRKVASFRKLPHLSHFKLIKKLYLHCSWDKAPCYIYERISTHA